MQRQPNAIGLCGEAVAAGKVWLLALPASLLAEPIPAGVLGPSAKLKVPPAVISAAAILPENLPGAWKDDNTTALAIASALSQQAGYTLPWKTVRRDRRLGPSEVHFVG